MMKIYNLDGYDIERNCLGLDEYLGGITEDKRISFLLKIKLHEYKKNHHLDIPRYSFKVTMRNQIHVYSPYFLLFFLSLSCLLCSLFIIRDLL